MTVTPVEGVRYWWNQAAQQFEAPGRLSLPVATRRVPGQDAGADEQVSYPMPTSNFVVWDPTGGVDSAAGTVAAPVKTLPVALGKITAGGTVVVRGGVHAGVGYRIASAGSYNANLGYGGLDVSKRCTIQPFPGERVIFDGTRDESGGWTASGGRWSKPISITVDRGVTYSYGQLDNDSRGDGWLWVRSEAWRTLMLGKGYSSQAAEAFPLAGWAEQVWIDDVQQTQVATLGEVGPGKYYVQGSSGGTNGVLFTSATYHLGSDPTGKTVRVGELSTSLRLSQAGSTLRGLTFRRYVGSNHMGGVIKATSGDSTLEHVVVEHASNLALDLFEADGSTVRSCEFRHAGNMSIRTNRCYNIVLDRVKAHDTNAKRYNWSPVSGGIRLATSRNVLIDGCDLRHNWTCGFWADVSNYDVKVVNTALDSNESYGAVFEIGAKGLLANCTVTGNGSHGLVVLDTHDVSVWNCVFAGNGRLRNLVYDGRNPRNMKIYSDDRRVVDSPPGSPGQGEYPSYGRDPRQPVPDPTMNNWLIQAFELKNCIVAAGDLQFAYLPVEDLQGNSGRSRNWTDYGLRSNGNLFNRVSASSPSWAFLLPGAGPGSAQTIQTTVSAWRSTTGQDLASVEVIGPSVVDTDGWLTPTHRANYGKGGALCPAVPLPADVAALIGKPVGDRHVGPYDN